MHHVFLLLGLIRAFTQFCSMHTNDYFTSRASLFLLWNQRVRQLVGLYGILKHLPGLRASYSARGGGEKPRTAAFSISALITQWPWHQVMTCICETAAADQMLQVNWSPGLNSKHNPFQCSTCNPSGGGKHTWELAPKYRFKTVQKWFFLGPPS